MVTVQAHRQQDFFCFQTDTGEPGDNAMRDDERVVHDLSGELGKHLTARMFFLRFYALHTHSVLCLFVLSVCLASLQTERG